MAYENLRKVCEELTFQGMIGAGQDGEPAAWEHLMQAQRDAGR